MGVDTTAGRYPDSRRGIHTDQALPRQVESQPDAEETKKRDLEHRPCPERVVGVGLGLTFARRPKSRAKGEGKKTKERAGGEDCGK